MDSARRAAKSRRTRSRRRSAARTVLAWTQKARCTAGAAEALRGDRLDTTLGDFHDMREALRPLANVRIASRRNRTATLGAAAGPHDRPPFHQRFTSSTQAQGHAILRGWRSMHRDASSCARGPSRGPRRLPARCRPTTAMRRPPSTCGAIARSGSPTSTSARPAARPSALLDFLKRTDCETLFLVGDIVDGWQLRRQLVLAAGAQRRRPEAAAQGAQGHAGDLRPGQPRRVRAPLRRPRVRRHRGRRGLDPRRPPTAGGCGSRTATCSTASIQCAKWLAHVGDSLYEFTLRLNRHLNSLRARLGLPYWSLSKLPQAEGQARGQLRRRLRGGGRARGAPARRRTASSAATSTTPSCARSTASSTPTTATGSRA